MPSNYLAQDFTSGMSTDGFVGSSAGFYGVQTLVDLANLPPPGNMTAGEVQSENTWYFYDSSSMLPPDGLNVIIPISVLIIDPGRWLAQSGTGSAPADVYNMAFRVGSARNKSVATNLWLFGDDGMPMNLSPVSFPFPCELVGIVAGCQAAATWTAEVYKNADIVGGGPTGTPVAILSVVATTLVRVRFATPVPLLATDRVATFMRGTGVSFPRVDLYIKPKT